MQKYRIYKEVSFDASHRLLHYQGKCANIHGHRWRVEVWIEGERLDDTNILVDYNRIREIVERFDHQLILNSSDPLVACISPHQAVLTTPGDPSSELIAAEIARAIRDECGLEAISARLCRVRVWESPSCCAEWTG